MGKMAEKSSPRLFGRKWIFAWCTPWTPRQPGSQVENGRKWPKMGENGRKKVHRGYLVGNGFSRVSRHSPTTANNW